MVGKFVEFFGPGLDAADRSPTAPRSPTWRRNTAPPAASSRSTTKRSTTCALTGRDDEQVALVEAYTQGAGHVPHAPTARSRYTPTCWSWTWRPSQPSLAGPKRPQDRVLLTRRQERSTRRTEHGSRDVRYQASSGCQRQGAGEPSDGERLRDLADGAVVIAAITSCTNTSNPSVMLAAGLLRASNAVAKGLNAKPWVKTSLAPGSKVVTDYLNKAGLLDGSRSSSASTSSATAAPPASATPARCRPESAQAIAEDDLVVARVLSAATATSKAACTPQVQANYLASPPLVVAYALAGTVRYRPDHRAARHRRTTASRSILQGHLADARRDSATSLPAAVSAEMFPKQYASVFDGDEQWKAIDVAAGDLYDWDDDSTYIQNPPYFAGMTHDARAVSPTSTARACWRCWAIPSPPTTSRRRARSSQTSPGGQVSDRARRARRRISTPTARAAATTRS